MSSSLSNIAAKYAHLLTKRAQDAGTSVESLKATVAATRRPQPVSLEAAKLLSKPRSHAQKTPPPPSRKDASPVKVSLFRTPLVYPSHVTSQPLAHFMDLQKLLATPHTPAQVSALWTAYHASRSDRTGRGFLSATIPLPTYHDIARTARKYPTFVVPLPRPAAVVDAPDPAQSAYEFHFMQWAFHAPPPTPSPDPLPFLSDPHPPASGPPPPISTVLFTPLQEYKLRQSFATPHLILTHYTDLAHSHGLVLLRGEITPSPSGVDGRYLLSQHDAQLLALAVQRFYLPGMGHRDNARADLLRLFHEAPHDFNWETLLQHADPTHL